MVPDLPRIMLIPRNVSQMVRCHIECGRTVLECATASPYFWSSHTLVLMQGQHPPSPRISVHSALPALLGTLICCKMLKILSSIPCMEGLTIRTLSQELKDKPSLRKLTEMLGSERRYWVCILLYCFLLSFLPTFLSSFCHLHFFISCVFLFVGACVVTWNREGG